ncbi:amidohydrolase [uncultured Ferrimonas sp.]|uniref:amidohydrolase n=1 Tax=uncultured Ferrimonas sp. TaxID=432640 RepID=UPI002613437B|nr:amidohydrolase [uncultured Ferrimonas sp.]
MNKGMLATALLALLPAAHASESDALAKHNASLTAQVVEWRRHLHQHPELSNRETATAAYVAEHLRQLGLQLTTGVAHTGVVALLDSGKPGPTVMLRADMDALPVTEQVDLPFASTTKTTFRGQEVGVMHACGHDAHVAILMGVAQSLTQMKQQLNGKVLFVFQPAEEGAPEGEEGGAELMLKEGLFQRYQPDVAFGLHVTSALPVGVIGMKSGPAMASADRFVINVSGEQTHGSRPWNGADPIVASANIINAVQTLVSRQLDITKAPAVVSFGSIHGGVRSNIIPDQVELVGTIRTFDEGMRAQIHQHLPEIAANSAASLGATAATTVEVGYPVTVNDPQLSQWAMPYLAQHSSSEAVVNTGLITGAEDFSFFAQQVPGVYFFLGVTPQGQDPRHAPSNHSPKFYIDEAALPVGVNALTQLTLAQMNNPKL